MVSTHTLLQCLNTPCYGVHINTLLQCSLTPCCSVHNYTPCCSVQTHLAATSECILLPCPHTPLLLYRRTFCRSVQKYLASVTKCTLLPCQFTLCCSTLVQHAAVSKYTLHLAAVSKYTSLQCPRTPCCSVLTHFTAVSIPCCVHVLPAAVSKHIFHLVQCPNIQVAAVSTSNLRRCSNTPYCSVHIHLGAVSI